MWTLMTVRQQRYMALSGEIKLRGTDLFAAVFRRYLLVQPFNWLLLGKEQGNIFPAESAVASGANPVSLQYPPNIPPSHRINVHVENLGYLPCCQHTVRPTTPCHTKTPHDYYSLSYTNFNSTQSTIQSPKGTERHGRLDINNFMKKVLDMVRFC